MYLLPQFHYRVLKALVWFAYLFYYAVVSFSLFGCVCCNCGIFTKLAGQSQTYQGNKVVPMHNNVNKETFTIPSLMLYNIHATLTYNINSVRMAINQHQTMPISSLCTYYWSCLLKDFSTQNQIFLKEGAREFTCLTKLNVIAELSGCNLLRICQ